MYHDDAKPIAPFKIAIYSLTSNSCLQTSERFIHLDSLNNPIITELYGEIDTLLETFIADDEVSIMHRLEKHPDYWITHNFTTKMDGKCVVKVWRSPSS